MKRSPRHFHDKSIQFLKPLGFELKFGVGAAVCDLYCVTKDEIAEQFFENPQKIKKPPKRGAHVRETKRSRPERKKRKTKINFKIQKKWSFVPKE